MGFPGRSDSKESPCNAGDLVRSLGWEDPLEKGIVTHSSTLAWENPMDRGAEQSTVHGFQRVGHDCCGKINIHNINFTILILLKFRYNSVTLGALTRLRNCHHTLELSHHL